MSQIERFGYLPPINEGFFGVFFLVSQENSEIVKLFSQQVGCVFIKAFYYLKVIYVDRNS